MFKKTLIFPQVLSFFSKEFSVDQRLLDCMKISAVFVALYLKEIVQKKKS